MPNIMGTKNKYQDLAHGALQICHACLVLPRASYEQAIPLRRIPCLLRRAWMQRNHAERWQIIRQALLNHLEVLSMHLGEIATVLQDEH